MEATQTHFFSDISVMVGRSMRHVFRSLDTIITVTIMPIAFMLLFVYVFGGAINTGTHNYVNYLLPGILLIAIATGTSYTAYRPGYPLNQWMEPAPFPTLSSSYRLSVPRLCLQNRCRWWSVPLPKTNQ